MLSSVLGCVHFSRVWQAILLLAAAISTGRSAGIAWPERPVQSISSPAMPDDVCIPAGFRNVPVNYFDDYSWRAFVAMVWPAAAGHRGTADETKPAGAAGPRVFETPKSLWEVFHRDAGQNIFRPGVSVLA
jgi:hypothetical protein